MDNTFPENIFCKAMMPDFSTKSNQDFRTINANHFNQISYICYALK